MAPRSASQPPPQTQLPNSGIDEHGHEQGIDEEGRPLPTLGHGAGRNGDRGVHEDHLEQEQREDADVVHVAAQEEAPGTEDVEGLPEQGDAVLTGEGWSSSEGRDRAHPAHLKRETAHPVAEHAQRVDHVVHRERVGRVLGSSEARLDHGEPGLHEHDQEAGHERPYDVYGDLVVAHRLHDLGESGIGRILDGHVRGGARGGSGWVSGSGRSRRRRGRRRLRGLRWCRRCGGRRGRW